jgi:hypothetical protein
LKCGFLCQDRQALLSPTSGSDKFCVPTGDVGAAARAVETEQPKAISSTANPAQAAEKKK